MDKDGNGLADFSEDKNNNGVPDGQDDDDNDGINNVDDNLPKTPNPDQKLPDDIVFGECVDNSKLPIVAEVYRLATNTQKLPDFDKLKQETVVCMPNYDVPERDWTAGFDGLSSELVEWFGLYTYSTIIIPESGKYTFELASDDGAILYIDGKEVINNDEVHGRRVKTGDITLDQGEHKLVLTYFQGPRYKIALELSWKTPSDGNMTIVPQSAFKYSPDHK